MDDVNFESFSSSYSNLGSPKTHTPKPSGSGLTLVIPSLKSLKASQTSAKKPRSQQAALSTPNSAIQDVESQERKIPRPAKLKPLKEVLTKLIAQIKKKDDYAFFLSPVPSNVAGYADLIKFPMDFGTMTDKANRGKYRSLEEFASDFRLVTMNAKIFNPPGSIYHTEADRIENWGVDHINRAASTVIQNETDWSIDVENEDEEQPVNVDRDDDENGDTTMDVDSSSLRERSLSIAPSQQLQQGLTRRTTRGPAKKPPGAPSNALSEGLESDGGLPGSKDGLGAFPAESDWAKTMLALKLKGKRYKTKKERMRIERSGPPLLPDGSLDYTEMEDPFSVLWFFVPEPLTRPHLVHIYQPLYIPTQLAADGFTPSGISPQAPLLQRAQSTSSTSSAPSVFPSATSLTPDYTPPSLPFLTQSLLTQSDASGNANPSAPHLTRRHWVINRNSTSRQKGKEKEDDQQEDIEPPTWQTPREAHAVDFGSFSTLAGALSAELQKRGVTAHKIAASGSDLHDGVDQQATLDLIKDSLDLEGNKLKGMDAENKDLTLGEVPKATVTEEMNATNLLTHGYWTNQRAIEAEEYLKDVVYGGVGGLAYVRSLAEFSGRYPLNEQPTGNLRPLEDRAFPVPLMDWVVNNIIDSLTDGRHALLRETAHELIYQHNQKPSNVTIDPRKGTVSTQVTASLYLFPATLIALSSLLHIRLHKIDMGSLLKTPQELFLSEEEWAGKGIKEKRRHALGAVERPKSQSDKVNGDSSTHTVDAMEVEEPEQTWVGVDADATKAKANGVGHSADYELEGPEELREVLDYVASLILEIDKKARVEKAQLSDFSKQHSNGFVDVQPGRRNEQGCGSNGDSARNVTLSAYSTKTPTTPNTAIQSQQDPSLLEDPSLRSLRLNLLALAKRAPLDTIARLPKDLVPEHIRHFVPTFGTSG
ncbi:hypothetical protein CPB83DRAFT_762505 [Crepidotus variabilis]|uniref:Bromo domain-containing protein n=1 Tax=Crepidotus variabilis TaxID=179855 RepID=A0A9P6EKD2_9AGAR|nr:hypothetical protein CPB83DRAFT_762505 [Crepidotus variabilis]